MIVQALPYPPTVSSGSVRQVMVVGDPILGPTYFNASNSQRRVTLPTAAYYNE